ncbi:MAG: NapC/NirT family cytochrome c [Gammaproteobacteria bacterium]|nr:NapC/NirT family cytochrome c [Gammaproteobacteria bacterium]
MKNKLKKLANLWFSLGFMVFGLSVSAQVQAETNKALEDCESCHAAQADEFQVSVHYINRSGVQASCNKCHADMKHRKGAKTVKKVKKPRLDMAFSEWKRMKANNSKECKSCHSPLAMDLAKQEPGSVTRHEESFDEGNTSCITCHKGISHKLPAGWKEKAQKVGLHK